MSADNWTVCPQCVARHNRYVEDAERNLQASYGKVTSEAFLDATKALEAMRTWSFELTLREDYELGIREGEFSVEYSAGCSTCGFGWSYKHFETPTISLAPAGGAIGPRAATRRRA